MSKLGHDLNLLHRGISDTAAFGKKWCIHNLFLIPEGMVIISIPNILKEFL
jgi:hypothetical protein